MSQFTILHTNDFHSHLSEQAGNFIRDERAKQPNVMLLDAGDAVAAGNMGVRPFGEPTLVSMTGIGYDAMTMGNREFHIADLVLRNKIKSAGFPILCANMRWREDNGTTLPVVPFIIKMIGSYTVGVIGVTVPMVTPKMAARVVSAYVFEDPVLAVKRSIDMIRNDVQFIVALTHIGIREDERLATEVPKLNLIIGGHSHVVLNELKRVNGVSIAQGGWYGHYLGRIDVDMAEEEPLITGRLIGMRN